MDSLSFYFPPEYLRAGRLVSLLSVWLLVGLFAYLNHYTRRRYFTIWTAAWLFYALWLTLNFSQEGKLVLMFRQWCVGTSAVFLFWGSLVFMGRKIRQTLVGLFIAFLLVWSYVGVYHAVNPIEVRAAIFGMLGIASFRVAYCFFTYRRQRRYIGASLLAVGMVLWGIYLGGCPFWSQNPELEASSFFLCGVIQLFIAVSMIILVLEEARASLNRFMETSRFNREACVGLQHEMRCTEARYRQLFEQASDGIVITNPSNLNILELNPRARRLLQLTKFDPGTISLRAFLEISGGGCDRRSGPECFEQIRQQATLNLIAANGAKTPVEVEAASIEFGGQPACQFSIRELTERVRLEQQLRQSEKLSALGQMISGIAHELNNPLAVIKGYVDLILHRHELPDRTRTDLQKVASESTRAARLVRNFLSLAREQPAQRTPLDVNQLVERVVELRQFDLRAAQVEVRLDLAPSLPGTLADADQIQQVVVNLISNSVQAMAGQPRPAILQLRTERNNGHIQLHVEDNGPGVPKDLESKIFEPFFTTKEVGKGTGLGLSIAHSIMSEHSGRIYYQTSRLGGAGFTLEWPAVASQPATAAAPLVPDSASEITASASFGRAAHILILDDEKVLCEMLGQIVEHLGHHCTLCHSPVQALEHIQTQDFDLVLSDYRMPVMDGQQFYRRATELNPALSSRFIFLTGDVLNEDTQNFLASAGNVYITKPFQIRAVESTVNSRLCQRDTLEAETEDCLG